MRSRSFGLNQSFSPIVGSILLLIATSAPAAQWTIPVAGNAYRPANSQEERTISRSGSIELRQPTDAYSIYFRVDRPCEVELSLAAKARKAGAKVDVQVAGQSLSVTLDSAEQKLLGHWQDSSG